MRWFADLKGYYSAVGSRRFWTFMLGSIIVALLYAGAVTWLSIKVGWPENYGFDCHGRGCLIDNLSHSPRLLRGGNAHELSLFVLLWSLPAFVVGCVIYGIVKKQRRAPVQPKD